MWLNEDLVSHRPAYGEGRSEKAAGPRELVSSHQKNAFS